MLHWDLSGALCGVSLVASGARGPQHVFSYPNQPHSYPGGHPSDSTVTNAVGDTSAGEYDGQNTLFDMPPQTFAHMMAPKSQLCNKAFEVRIDDIKFVSFPTVLPTDHAISGSAKTIPGDAGADSLADLYRGSEFGPEFDDPTSTLAGGPMASMGEDASGAGNGGDVTHFLMFAIVFALDMSKSNRSGTLPGSKPVQQDHDAQVKSYSEVARKLSAALVHEERRCQYLSKEAVQIMNLCDHGAETQAHLIDLVLQCSTLANDIRRIYNGLRDSGSVNVCINGWVDLHLTLEDKTSIPSLPIRPYQTLLLLSSNKDVLEQLPEDASGELRMLIRAANPVRSFQELTVSTGIPLAQLFRLAAHLVYWEKGRIVDTITTHSTYVVSPLANAENTTTLASKFQHAFQSHLLSETLSRFSHPKKMGEHLRPLNSQQQSEFISIVIFLLRHSLIVQLHTYVVLQVVADSAFAATATDAADVKTLMSGYYTKTTPGNTPNGSGNLAADGIGSGSDDDDDLGSRSDEDNDTGHVELVGDGAGDSSRRTRGLTRIQHAYLQKIANESPVYKLLRRLAPYFNGTFHLEEIMWRENLARADFTILLNTYKEVVICFTSE